VRKKEKDFNQPTARLAQDETLSHSLKSLRWSNHTFDNVAKSPIIKSMENTSKRARHFSCLALFDAPSAALNLD